MTKRSNSIRILLFIFLTGIVSASCSRPMPEPESYAFKLYARKCGLCHRVYHPKILNKRTWGIIVEKMERKVKKTERRVPLTKQEKEVILGYLRKHSRERGL